MAGPRALSRLAKQINSYIRRRELTSSRSQVQRWTVTDPAAELISVLRRFIDDVNSGNGEAALGRLTEDVCIVEDIAPFRWTGPQAGGQWLGAMGTNAQRLGITAITMTPGDPRRTEVEGDHGYCIMPGRVTLEGPDTTLYEDGLLTFAMRLEREQWKISAMTWTGDRLVEA